MNCINESSRNTDVKGSFDVVVCGGGIAGISAAISAARENRSVLLIENQFVLGGLATAGLITIYLPLCDGEGHQVSFGICEELIKLSVSKGYEIDIPETWKTSHTLEERANGRRYECRYNAQVFAILCEQLLTALGVKILYGSRVCAVNTENDRITHVVVENKGGRAAYSATAVVDATGDADVCKLSNIKTADFTSGNSLAAWYYFIKDGKSSLNMLGFSDSVDEKGNYIPNINSLSDRRYYGLDGDDLTDMVMDAHNALLKSFLSSGEVSLQYSLATMATVPQIRMTRRIKGKFELDTAHERKYFESSIGMISDWRKKGYIYEVPYETLFSKEMKNLFVAGRCISVRDGMWDITRVIPACAVTGEAAGIAAAYSGDCTAEYTTVAQVLKKRNIPLHIDEII